MSKTLGRPRRLILGSLSFALILLPAGLAFAGGDGGHGEEHASPAGALIRHSINLAILLAALFYFLRTPLADFLGSRRLEVKNQLDESADIKAKADARYKEIEGRLASFDKEIDSIMGDAHVAAEAERGRIIEQAERSAGNLEEAAKRTVADELRRAREELRTGAIDAAVAAATEILTAQVGDADHSRLATDYLGKVEERART